MSADNQLHDYQEEIKEWSMLKKHTQNTNVLGFINDRILALERRVENLGPAKQLDSTTSYTTSKTVTRNMPQTTTATPPELYVPIVNFSWDQTSTTVKIYISLNNQSQITEEDVEVKFQSESLDVIIKSHVSGTPSQRLYIKKLFKSILTEKSKFRVRNHLLTIVLEKSSNTTWEDVRYKEAQKPPKLGKDLDDPNTDPGTSLMKLMKNLYEEGDDEMKRTIAKAWTESQSKQGMMNNFGAI